MRPGKFLFIAIAIMLSSCSQTQQDQEKAADATKTDTIMPAPLSNTIDEGKLLGSWVRTDSPYEIRILEFRTDGNLLAGYFNPKSINVGKATWSKAETVYLYVELQDQNYPGSNYLLKYMPEEDMLTGKYFQAVEGVTYDVSFSRKK